MKKAIFYTDADIFEVKHYLQHSKQHFLITFKEKIKDKVNIIKQNKKIVFDSSTLISLGSVCIYGEIVKMHKEGFEFYIPKGVREEVIDIGNKIFKFKWNAERIDRLINSGVIIEKNIKNHKLYDDLELHTNQIFKTKHGNLEILQKGELEAMILAQEIKGILAVDELATRLLIENPKDLITLIQKRYKTKIFLNNDSLKKYYNIVKNIKVVRSIDITAFGYKDKLFENYKNQNILKALLYSLKYSGCSTTFEEINQYIIKEGL